MLHSSQSSLCRNCHRQVPLSSFTIHETMCFRINVLCPKCNAVVKKGEMVVHDEQNHRLVDCNCGLKVEQSQLNDHKLTSCDLRKVSCMYCQYSVIAREMDEHTLHCSTRTEPCPYCKKFIILSEMEIHVSKCLLNPDTHIRNYDNQFCCPRCEYNLKQILSEQPYEQLLSTYTTESFIRHVKSEHSNDSPLKLICPICSIKHDSQSVTTPPVPVNNLYQHILLHEIRYSQEQQWRNKKLSERFT